MIKFAKKIKNEIPSCQIFLKKRLYTSLHLNFFAHGNSKKSVNCIYVKDNKIICK